MTKIKAMVLAIALSIEVGSPSYASGIPCFDGANLAQALQDFMNQLDQIENQIDQIEKAKEQYEQQIKDTIKPVADAYDKVNSTRQKYEAFSNFAQNLGGGFSDIEGYISNTIGSREKWEQCVADSNCNPLDYSSAAWDKFGSFIDRGMERSLALSESTRLLADTAPKDFSSKLKSDQDKGINATIQRNAEINVAMYDNQLRQTQVIAEYIKEQQEQKRLEIEERNARIKENERQLQLSNDAYKKMKGTRSSLESIGL